MTNSNLKTARITLETWAKFIVPAIEDNHNNTIIFYKTLKDLELIRIRTYISGFEVMSFVSFQKLRELYEDKELEVGIEQPPETSESDLMNKFNQDYLNARGIPELD